MRKKWREKENRKRKKTRWSSDIGKTKKYVEEYFSAEEKLDEDYAISVITDVTLDSVMNMVSVRYGVGLRPTAAITIAALKDAEVINRWKNIFKKLIKTKYRGHKKIYWKNLKNLYKNLRKRESSFTIFNMNFGTLHTNTYKKRTSLYTQLHSSILYSFYFIYSINNNHNTQC